MATTRKFVFVCLVLFCVCIASPFITTCVNASSSLLSNDELRERRLRDLADTIAELKNETEGEDEEHHTPRNLLSLQSAAEPVAATAVRSMATMDAARPMMAAATLQSADVARPMATMDAPAIARPMPAVATLQSADLARPMVATATLQPVAATRPMAAAIPTSDISASMIKSVPALAAVVDTKTVANLASNAVSAPAGVAVVPPKLAELPKPVVSTPLPIIPPKSTAVNITTPSAPRKVPEWQGTNRKDLVALYRFESKSNPGRGFGGAGKDLQVFGTGASVVKGTDVKMGEGSLFMRARPASVPEKLDPINPYQNTYLARDSKGTPINGLPKGSESFTLAAWFKVAAGKPGQFGIVSFGTDGRNTANQMKATSGGQGIATFGDNPMKTNNTDDKNPEWHHQAVVWDSNTQIQSIYIDGEISNSRKMDSKPDVTLKTFFLGLTSNAPESEQFSGFLDDVAIFRVALLPEEIRTIKTGKFEPYLDLFALRGCKTRIGRRQHGAGYLEGAVDESISVNDKFKYGFDAKNSGECAVKCAQTANCLQGVFIANKAGNSTKSTNSTATTPPRPVAALKTFFLEMMNSTIVKNNSTRVKNSNSSSKSIATRAGKCFLQSVAYTAYEKSKRSITTVCKIADPMLQKKSFLLKPSADADSQKAKREKRMEKEKNDKIAAAKAAEAKKLTDAQKAAQAKLDELAKAKAAAVAAELKAKLDAIKKKEADAKLAKEKAANEAKLIAAKKKELDDLEKKAKEKKAKEDAERIAKELAAKAAKKNVTDSLKKKVANEYETKIEILKKALKESNEQSKHRSIIDNKKSSEVIEKLTKRLEKLESKLNKREEDNKMLALAQKIKIEADIQAEKIATTTAVDAKELKIKSARLHRLRLRRQLDRKNGFIAPPCKKQDQDELDLDLEEQNALEKKEKKTIKPTLKKKVVKKAAAVVTPEVLIKAPSSNKGLEI